MNQNLDPPNGSFLKQCLVTLQNDPDESGNSTDCLPFRDLPMPRKRTRWGRSPRWRTRHGISEICQFSCASPLARHRSIPNVDSTQVSAAEQSIVPFWRTVESEMDAHPHCRIRRPAPNGPKLGSKGLYPQPGDSRGACCTPIGSRSHSGRRDFHSVSVGATLQEELDFDKAQREGRLVVGRDGAPCGGSRSAFGCSRRPSLL